MKFNGMSLISEFLCARGVNPKPYEVNVKTLMVPKILHHAVELKSLHAFLLTVLHVPVSEDLVPVLI